MATEKERRAQEQNDDLKRQVLLLQQQNESLMTSHRRFEQEFEHAGNLALKEADIEESDAGMQGLKEGQDGFLEAKVAVLSGYSHNHPTAHTHAHAPFRRS